LIAQAVRAGRARTSGGVAVCERVWLPVLDELVTRPGTIGCNPRRVRHREALAETEE
jgi:hypothetical protein